MKTAFNPSFRPSRTFVHPILGKIDEYHFTGASLKRWKRSLNRAVRGVQSYFILNNAKPHNDNHYALKVYNTLTEAAAAWERQSLGARKNLAPPVRRLCKFVYPNGKVYWGYQTCVASHIERVSGIHYLDWDSPRRSSHRVFVRAVSSLNLVGTINDLEEHYRGSFKRFKFKRTLFHGDLHEGNIGFYKHKMVLIDFGRESVEASDGEFTLQHDDWH